ncbi:MAG TPA: hypothetical protein VFV59_00165 [Candidatus Limnocylindria bacterium]|nr:hypothetical protein [Candidatus Limnocylindria bacterium]
MGGAPPPPELGVRSLTGITDLPARLAALNGPARERADRLLDASLVHGRTVPPPELLSWLQRTFGSVDAVRKQTIVKVTNLATLEAALFAPLRAHRPIDGPAHRDDLAAQLATTGEDPFCDPETGTPGNIFGRVTGPRITTGANAALADAHHGVLVFHAHDPLAFDAELVAEVISTGRAWADLARAEDPSAANYLLIWNCLWRAGGSIVHGHAQALLGGGPEYARLARFQRDAIAYRASFDASLVDDLVALHRDLELAADRAGGVSVLAHLTPIKEREVLVIGRPGMDERDPAFADAVASTLVAYRDRMGVRSFNLALWRPPVGATPDGPWRDIPPIVRMVDRGDPLQRASDIGAMELYGTPIVGSDPYEVIAALSQA